MTDTGMYFRLCLLLGWMWFAYSTNEIDSESLKLKSKDRSPIALEGRDRRRNEENHHRSPLFQLEPDDHNRFRRQSGCCTASPPSCINSIYRTIDGTCNNWNNPCWGSAGMPFNRMLTPQYGNGIDTPRGTGSSPALPKPRTVAAGMVNTSTTPTPDKITDFVMLWGQFLDHDITFTPDFTVTNCCPNSTNSTCMPLDVSEDAFYSNFNITCLELGRSIPSTCSPGTQREQMNLLTSYIDASHIYGSSLDQLNSLRVNNSFLLKFGPGNEISTCPANPSSPTLDCRFTFLPSRTNNETGNEEFFAGDGRLEEQPSLTSLHTVFLRMHNYFATIISQKNPSCSNNIVFQETRKIVGALMQQITYNEFLPILLGSQKINDYNLYLGPLGAYDPYFYDYNQITDPTAFNVFSTASYRFGHSLIRNTFNMPGGSVVQLSESFNNHGRTLNSSTLPSHFMKAGASDPSEEMDHILVSAVHNKLFAASPFEHGSDLYSRNIMRGRDHGLRPYIDWLNDCIQKNVSTFENLTNYMPSVVVDKLKILYNNRLSDIDLFPAAIAEYNIAGDALLGTTFACLNGRYFKKLKYGDRYWFERPNLFSWWQLYDIRTTTLSSILCLLTNATEYQKYVMEPANNGTNKLTSCSTLMSIGVVKYLNSSWSGLC